MFTLASASGNVFAYAWRTALPQGFEGGEVARRLCPRGVGLGLDGLFVMEPFQAGKTWELTHWEPDGTATFCSNGTRAAGALLPPGVAEVAVASNGQQVRLQREDDRVRLRLPVGPGFGLQTPSLDLDLPHAYGWTGTPHLIVEVPAVAGLDLARVAPPLRHHPRLPEGANVSFIEVPAEGPVRIRSWERGVEGETLCCGQGCAVAAAWLARRTGRSTWDFQPEGEDPVQVEAVMAPDGAWRDLWLGGRVRVLGAFTSAPGLIGG